MKAKTIALLPMAALASVSSVAAAQELRAGLLLHDAIGLRLGWEL